MIDIEALIQPHLLKMSPYSSARDEFKGSDGTFLDANENPYRLAGGESYNRYPDPYQLKLKEEISKLKKIPVDQIFLGNGSDEAIDLIIRLFCTPMKDSVVVLPPTYGMYEVSASINNNQVKKSTLTVDFQINVPDLLSRIDDNTKIIFICNPNNPTGTLANPSDILNVIQKFKGIVVVDEAYIDFIEKESILTHLHKFNNLVILQTLSKAWGLAGLRLGIAFADPLIIQYLNKIKPPYNINAASQDLALKALKDIERKKSFVNEINESKEVLVSELKKLGFTREIFDTSANFILVRFTNAPEVFDFLLRNKVIVRDRSKVILCDETLRITIGTPEENNILIEVLKKYNKV